MVTANEKDREEILAEFLRGNSESTWRKPVRCPHCGFVNPPRHFLCQQCGNPTGEDSVSLYESDEE